MSEKPNAVTREYLIGLFGKRLAPEAIEAWIEAEREVIRAAESDAKRQAFEDAANRFSFTFEPGMVTTAFVIAWLRDQAKRV